MKEKTFKHYRNLSNAVKIGLVLVILNLCHPCEVSSKIIVPLSFLGRTNGRVNNHMMDQLMNMYLKGIKMCNEQVNDWTRNILIFKISIIFLIFS